MALRHPRLLGYSLAFYLACVAGMLACTPPVSIQTPEGKRAYTALEIAEKIGALQDTAIEANTNGGLDKAHADRVVSYTRSALLTLRELPAGWRITITVGYQELLNSLPPAVLDKYRTVFQLVAIALQLDFGIGGGL